MVRNCDVCGKAYEAKTKRSRYHSETCRKRAQRGGTIVPLRERPTVPSAFESTMQVLEMADRLSSPAGVNALLLAAKLDAGGDTGSAMAALSKQHLAALEEALRDAPVAADPLDELRVRRQRRLADG